MSSPALRFDAPYHVLNFFYDDEDNCALTAFINNVRFHVIAEKSKVRHSSIGQQYAKLLMAVQDANIEDATPPMSSDSGIDVTDEEVTKLVDSDVDPEEALHRWMLGPLGSDIDEHAPESEGSRSLSLEDWYNVSTHFYNLETKDKQLHAIELEPNDDLERRMGKLRSEIGVPKYVRKIDIPHYLAKDLVVVEGSDLPAPYHPARVQLRGSQEVLFLKVVDKGQPQPTKREVSMLHQVAQKGLHDHLRCPRLQGLVSFDEDDSKIMGFLQTDIDNPVPLTLKLDAEVPQKLRDRWAEEAERMKNVLHDHGMIWGDAKADNFMVDRNDDLWIIDFGGSYTEGWVDSELKETIEGDDMGVEKITNALHDPVANVWDPDTEKSFGGRSHDRKRKASDLSESDVVTKRQKGTASDVVYCYCDKPSSGRMIACDGVDCEREWFHFDCAGIDGSPEQDEWYCDDCITEG